MSNFVFHKGTKSSKKMSATETNRQQKNKTKNKKPKEVPEKGKKPPMKTAMDVVKRIMWDNALERDEFLVGYLDRIDGLKEKYFNAFSWEDIASVDYTVLAIPKHRIQYFKYKDVIVWDKRCRLDNVFGSTGSQKTITDIIAEVDCPKASDRVEGEDDNDNLNAAAEDNLGHAQHGDSDFYESGEYSDTDSDSDSDDGITVTLGTNGAIGGASGSYGDVQNGEFDVDADDAQASEYNKYWRDKLRPNYFIALRITDEDIRSSIEAIQNDIVTKEPRLKDCCIPNGALHLTLCTVGLDRIEQVANANQCLKLAEPELANMLPKDLKLTFKGIDTFFNRVIFAKVQNCPQEFLDFVDHIRMCLTASGIDIRDGHDFVPHVTVMKITRPVAKTTGNNYIAPWLYSAYNETVLGSQAVNNLHLCSMTDSRQDDGFYVTAASLQL